MFEFGILFPSVLNGLTTGAVYALVALGLTLIYGVLHIINFAHGAALMIALYGVYFLRQRWGIDPYAALLPMIAVMFVLGYALQRAVINRASHGKDENILLVTLGLSIVLENVALLAFKSDTRTIETSYTLSTYDPDLYCELRKHFDYVWFEMQHSTMSYDEVRRMLLACPGRDGAAPMIRSPITSPFLTAFRVRSLSSGWMSSGP